MNFDPQKPSALIIGRFQGFHRGHYELIMAAREKYGQVCIAVRDMPLDDNNPWFANVVVRRIQEWVGEDRIRIIIIPNIVAAVAGRAPGWSYDQMRLSDEIEALSATKVRATS